MMLVNSITKGWFCMAMLVYERVSFVIFVTRLFLIGTFHYPKKIGYGISWISVNFFPKKTTTQIPLFHHHFWASIMSHHVSFKSGRFPHQGATGEVSWGRELANLLREGAVIQEWHLPTELRWVDQLSNERFGPLGMFRVFLGDDNLPGYIRIIINHHKDPYQTTSIMNVCCICATVDSSEIPNNHPTCMKPCN